MRTVRVLPLLFAASIMLSACSTSGGQGFSLCAVVPPPAPAPAPPAPEPEPAPAPDPCDSVTRLYGVNFASDSAALDENAKSRLSAAVETLKQCPSSRIKIEAHTDSTGSDAYNQKLSERRAASVAAYLTGAGIDAAGLESEGLGESSPVATNATAAGRAENRRVEMRLSVD